jgi:CRISPR-associated protein Csm3
MIKLRFLGHATVTGKIVVRSGLHIGAGKDTIEIGGIDNPVIKHPHTQDPYIPGSSLKGKLRFLFEWAFHKIRDDAQPWGIDGRGNQRFEADDPVLRIFGTAAKREVWAEGPTRLVVRDATLDPEWRQDIISDGLPLTEEKTEVMIDRIAGKAHDRVGPRQTERVPAGARFDFELSFRLYDTGDGGKRDRECLNWTIAGLGLIEQDALGGSGSRGYGRVSFEDLEITLPDGRKENIAGRHRLNRFPVDEPPTIVSF